MACTHDHAPPSKRSSPMFPSAVHKCTLKLEVSRPERFAGSGASASPHARAPDRAGRAPGGADADRRKVKSSASVVIDTKRDGVTASYSSDRSCRPPDRCPPFAASDTAWSRQRPVPACSKTSAASTSATGDSDRPSHQDSLGHSGAPRPCPFTKRVRSAGGRPRPRRSADTAIHPALAAPPGCAASARSASTRGAAPRSSR